TPLEVVEKLEATGKSVFPSSAVLAQIQDKLIQKRKFQQEGIVLPRFKKVLSGADVLEAAAEFGFPVMLKARRGSSDGRGNVLIRRAHDIEPALKTLRGHELFAEEFVQYQRELAVIVVRWQDGSTRTYPVVEIFNEANICHIVHCPATIDEATAVHAVEAARQAVELLDGVGIFTVKLFEIEDNEVLLNEVTPRPHDAGHFTIEGVLTSQYENLLRAALDLAPGDVAQIAPATAMVNILGDGTGEVSFEVIRDVFMTEGTHIHWYGKTQMRPGTKLGHITVLGYNTDGAEKVGRLALSRVKLSI
ncbi:MAG: 5-(carboxyamino)imidazole ribonucleotide synthase, partial [Aggregatilineales bacterium]